MIEYKTCSNPDCEDPYLPNTEEYFYKQKITSKNGDVRYKLTPRCKKCTIKNNRKRTIENKERYYEIKRNYYLKNREKLIKQITVTNNLNIERRRYTQSQWRKSNPEKTKEYRIDRNQHKKHEIKPDEWSACKEYFNNECAYCGLKLEEHYITYGGETKLGDFHKEHVDDEGTNDLSNCVPSCKSCNSKKRNMEVNDWFITMNIEKYRIDKINQWLKEDYKLFVR